LKNSGKTLKRAASSKNLKGGRATQDNHKMAASKSGYKNVVVGGGGSSLMMKSSAKWLSGSNQNQ
jgi:hypothetical protein